ncbi:MAG: rhamnan synthesis F family protein, partial [Corynebacterium variabile]
MSTSPSPALSGVLRTLAGDPKLRGLVTHVGDSRLHIQGPEASWPFALGTLAQHAPVLVITATGRQAEDLTAELTAMLGDVVAQFPAWETLPHERLSPGIGTVAERMRVLHRLAHGELKVVVAPTRAAVQPVMAGLGDITPVRLAEGEELDFSEVQERLVELGYTHAVADPREDYPSPNPVFDNAALLLADGCPILKRRNLFHDPLYLDRHAIIGADMLELAEKAGYDTDLILTNLARTSRPRDLVTNAGLTTVISPRADQATLEAAASL